MRSHNQIRHDGCDMTGLPNKDGAYWFQFSDFPVIVRKMPDWEEHKAYLNGIWYPVSTLAKGWWVGPLQKPESGEDAEKGFSVWGWDVVTDLSTPAYHSIHDKGGNGFERTLLIRDDAGNKVILRNEQIGELFRQIKPGLYG